MDKNTLAMAPALSTGEKEDALADPRIAALIRELAERKDLSPADLAKALDVPAEKLAATVSSEKRKAWAVLFARSVNDVLRLDRIYRGFLNEVLKELQTRPLQDMSTKDLLGVLDRIQRFIEKTNTQAMAVRPDKAEGLKDPQVSVTIDSVNFLMKAVHEDSESPREKRKRKAKSLDPRLKVTP
jgi:hypothetical protein